MARTPDPKSKAGFVRSQPVSMPAAKVVAAAKARGIKLDERYVYSVRTAQRKRTGHARHKARGLSVSPATRAAMPSSDGLQREIERIVERKVDELLKSRLGALIG